MQAIVIDQKLKSLVVSERKITYEILLLIQTLDITKSFRELGYSSIFEYLTKEIGYSESSAQRRISSARLMKQVPQIANDLKSGNLNLTQVSLAQMAIRQEEKAQAQKISFEQKTELLNKLKSKSTFETQKILKENLPAFEIPQTKVVPAENKVHVTLRFSDKDWKKVQGLLAHFSHTIPDQKIESLLIYWQAQVERKKQRQLERLQNQKLAVNDLQNVIADQMNSSMNQKVLKNPTANEFGQKMKSSDILLPLRKWKAGRSYIPVAVRVQVQRLAQDRCEFVSKATGKRCTSKHFLETEHRIPIAKGGTNAIENLSLLCRSHNALAAKIQGVSKADN